MRRLRLLLHEGFEEIHEFHLIINPNIKQH